MQVVQFDSFGDPAEVRQVVDAPDLPERVRAALAAAGAQPAALRLGIDAVGGHATGRLARAVAEGGTGVSYGSLSGEPCTVEARDTIFRDVTLKGFWLTRWIGAAAHAAREGRDGKVFLATG